jgi:hypothetical protein
VPLTTPKRWIDALLGQRTVTAVIRGESITMKVGKGCPQGGVLSPLKKKSRPHWLSW